MIGKHGPVIKCSETEWDGKILHLNRLKRFRFR